MSIGTSRHGGRRQTPTPVVRGYNPTLAGPLARILAGGFALLAVAGAAQAERPVVEQQPVAASMPAPAASSPRSPREMTYLKRTWGIEILFVRESSAGYMLEFRYKVIDAKKAAPLFERQTKPILTDVKTSAKMVVPTPAKTGALRNSNMPIDGRTYWMFFANPGKLVKVGDAVNIEIGKFLVEGLIVE